MKFDLEAVTLGDLFNAGDDVGCRYQTDEEISEFATRYLAAVDEVIEVMREVVNRG